MYQVCISDVATLAEILRSRSKSIRSFGLVFESASDCVSHARHGIHHPELRPTGLGQRLGNLGRMNQPFFVDGPKI